MSWQIYSHKARQIRPVTPREDVGFYHHKQIAKFYDRYGVDWKNKYLQTERRTERDENKNDSSLVVRLS